MRHDTWMERDERTPEEIDRQRLEFLQHEERTLFARLEKIQAQMGEILARPSPLA